MKDDWQNLAKIVIIMCDWIGHLGFCQASVAVVFPELNYENVFIHSVSMRAHMCMLLVYMFCIRKQK